MKILRWLLILAPCLPVSAQDDVRPVPAPRAGALTLFPALDRDGDGKLSAEEVDLAVASLRHLDRNGDGTVSGDEMRQRRDRESREPARGTPPWEEIDRNGTDEVWKVLAKKYDKDESGEISPAEYPRGAEKFSRLDRNGDGKLTASDFRGERGGRGGMSSMAYTRLARMADADENEELSRDEWKKFLSNLKANEDGVIARETFVALLREGGGGRMAERMIGMLDRNRDDELMVSELEAVWTALDRNDDGVVKGDEHSRRGGRGGRPERSAAPEVGAHAPDFELPYASREGEAEAGKKVRLSSFHGKKPVALVFGSYT